jgi:hypothetical protein
VTQNYKADFDEAVAELARLDTQRETLEIAIAKQKKKVAALHELTKSDDDAPALSGLVEGITDACRVVLRAANKALLPIEIRDKVQELGLPPQSNLLASVYTTLRRMKESGEIVEVFEVDFGGSSAVGRYKWAGDTVTDRLRASLGQRLYITDPRKKK